MSQGKKTTFDHFQHLPQEAVPQEALEMENGPHAAGSKTTNLCL